MVTTRGSACRSSIEWVTCSVVGTPHTVWVGKASILVSVSIRRLFFIIAPQCCRVLMSGEDKGGDRRHEDGVCSAVRVSHRTHSCIEAHGSKRVSVATDRIPPCLILSLHPACAHRFVRGSMQTPFSSLIGHWKTVGRKGVHTHMGPSRAVRSRGTATSYDLAGILDGTLP